MIKKKNRKNKKRGKRQNCTIIHTYVPEERVSSISIKDISLITLMLLCLTLRLGQHLLPGLTSTVVIKIREEDIEHLRVPRDRVTLDSLLDVLRNKPY